MNQTKKNRPQASLSVPKRGAATLKLLPGAKKLRKNTLHHWITMRGCCETILLSKSPNRENKEEKETAVNTHKLIIIIEQE